MKKKKNRTGAEVFGIRVITDNSRIPWLGKVLFPEDVERANKLLKNVKWPEALKR